MLISIAYIIFLGSIKSKNKQSGNAVVSNISQFLGEFRIATIARESRE